jgi:acetylglutamate kinase
VTLRLANGDLRHGAHGGGASRRLRAVAPSHTSPGPVETAIEKARVLLEALPYIRRFQGRTFVIKYGGHAMIAPELKDSFARDVCLLKYIGVNVIIVHGGGPQISAALKRSGVQSRFVDGLRVTDDATMDVVEMVLAGQINQDIVSLICRHGGRAVGLSGKDDGFILAEKSPPITSRDGESVDLGRVGEVRHVTPDVVVELTRAGFIPVIAPIGVDDQGASLNLNADTAAGKVAEALRAEKLILLTDVEAVRGEDGKHLSSLSATVARDLIARRVIDGGMIPKVECALDAIDGGVRKVHILDGRAAHAVLLEIFTDSGLGTEIVRAK